MKVLMITPTFGGIDTYVDRLRIGLQDLGVDVDLVGIPERDGAYDAQSRKWRSSEEVKAIVEDFVARLKTPNCDLLAFHFGKNDIEQFIPVVLSRQQSKLPPTLYFVHFLSRNLFSQYLGDNAANHEIEEQVGSFFDGYIFYGSFAREHMRRQYGSKVEGPVIFYPDAHSQEVIPAEEASRMQHELLPPEFTTKPNVPKIIWPGFPAHYKDHTLLLQALALVKTPVWVLFAGYGWEKTLSFTRNQIGRAQVFALERYLTPKEFAYLVRRTTFGVLLYRQPDNPDEIFQGSGTLPNFIYERKATIVLNEGAMAEYVGDSGIVVQDRDPQVIAQAIDELSDAVKRAEYENAANQRKYLFALDRHARACYQHFTELVGG